MKSYKHIFEKINNKAAVYMAMHDALAGRKKQRRQDAQRALKNVDKFSDSILEDLKNYKNKPHQPKEIYDGISRKKRTIIVPSFREQVIHHLLINALKPIFLQGIYEHAYGSIPKRGVHKAKKVIEKWIRTDWENCWYVLKIDIKKYFENIDHQILKEKLFKIIKDQKVIQLLFTIINVCDKGLPLGFYTSQWLSMWFLKDFDHYVKEKLRVRHYIRYMDDIIIFSNSKEELHQFLKDIKNYLEENKLELNRKTQIFPLELRPLDFMGFRFFRDKVILRKSILFKMCRKARRIGNKIKLTIFDLRQMMSYIGWLKSSQIYKVWKQKVKPYFNLKEGKRRISYNDRRQVIWSGIKPREELLNLSLQLQTIQAV